VLFSEGRFELSSIQNIGFFPCFVETISSYPIFSNGVKLNTGSPVAPSFPPPVFSICWTRRPFSFMSSYPPDFWVFSPPRCLPTCSDLFEQGASIFLLSSSWVPRVGGRQLRPLSSFQSSGQVSSTQAKVFVPCWFFPSLPGFLAPKAFWAACPGKWSPSQHDKTLATELAS